ncbi:methyltransferase domain-containing protein [Streptococcus oricebi]|uniref:rRNA (Guanine-N1)-methyltransferase n=1 Tax=Streptococcus oricebi TaxID=1547447 RepID=A0ABS5B6G9_9STRE|nr:methyltransferase domain-containing protein [Streptococcus oricebi]MBP2623569.1 rRNA (guanine-N1)-methyltransferase [Streptococcus oricebi]
MLSPKLQRFAAGQLLFSCPLCQQDLQLVDASLKCPQGHSYDLAKFGYVNLAPQAKVSNDYDQSSFEQRSLILEAGFYQHVLDTIVLHLERQKNLHNLLDIGCGEGYYARQLQRRLTSDIYAFDLSKASVQLASKLDLSRTVKWFVADLARLPLQDQSMDAVLDIFSPANYQEFQRVLKKDGLLLKVIPNVDHLLEIRQLAQDQLRQKDYSNQKVLEHFSKHFELLDKQTVSRIFPLNDNQRQAFLAMTPLLFHVDQSQIDWTQLTEITVSASLLLGRAK